MQKRRSSRLDILATAADKFSSEKKCEDPELVKINSMKVAELKTELKLRCLSIKGKKSVLMNWLIKAHQLNLNRYS